MNLAILLLPNVPMFLPDPASELFTAGWNSNATVPGVGLEFVSSLANGNIYELGRVRGDGMGFFMYIISDI